MVHRLLSLLIFPLFCSCLHTTEAEALPPSTDALRKQITSIIRSKKANIAVAIRGIEDNDTLYINAHKPYTIMSVVKFPQALAVLHKADDGTLSPDQVLHFDKANLHSGYSPLKDSLPEGNFNLPLRTVLSYAVSKSDNSACDKLHDLLGGPKATEQYIHQLGIKEMGVATTYERMKDDSLFINWGSANAITDLLYHFYQGDILSPGSRGILLDMMIRTSNDPRRIMGLLPAGTLVAHKTGTSGTDKGITAAFNDAGIVTLPDGRHFAITVLMGDSREPADSNARIIASITKAAWDYYIKKPRPQVAVAMDSLLNTSLSPHPFNGVVFISEKGRNVYSRAMGYSNLEASVPLAVNDQFVIGSVSKQITGVMVLREYEQGHLQLNVPIKKYLPDLQHPWANTITVHQLLTHTHGIPDDGGPVLKFTPGTQFSYSNFGYTLLGRILEKASGKSFPQLSAELFTLCGIKRTCHPEMYHGQHLVNGYLEQPDGSQQSVVLKDVMHGYFIAAGGFISTAEDLVTWNTMLHHGKLLNAANYKMMISAQKNAVRDHPLFGKLQYGCGITTNTQDNITQLGQTGYLPGYAAMSFYYPETGTSMVILSNTAGNPEHLKEAFSWHWGIMNTTRKYLSGKRSLLK